MKEIVEATTSLESVFVALAVLREALGPVLLASNENVYPTQESCPEGSSEALKQLTELDRRLFVLRMDIEFLTGRVQL